MNLFDLSLFHIYILILISLNIQKDKEFICIMDLCLVVFITLHSLSALRDLKTPNSMLQKYQNIHSISYFILYTATSKSTMAESGQKARVRLF